MRAQDALDKTTGFGEIRLGGLVSTLPFSCAHPVWCEGVYESARVRVWHASGLIQRVDVVYAGKSGDTGEEIQSSPITLAQAVRAHSIRYGQRVPRLGFGGSYEGARIIVDYANGIAYLADTAFVTSRVKEVRYLPERDGAIAAAQASPLSGHGQWLMQAARSAARYKNLAAVGEQAATEPARLAGDFSLEEVARRLEKMSSETRVYAQATLMLSARVMESLERKEAPDPVVSERLRKTYARLNATRKEALCLVDHYPDSVTSRDRASLPLELADEAELRMKELASRGFVE